MDPWGVDTQRISVHVRMPIGMFIDQSAGNRNAGPRRTDNRAGVPDRARARARTSRVGMDVVKVAPPYDQSEMTALAAAHIAADLLCLLRNQKLSAGALYAAARGELVSPTARCA